MPTISDVVKHSGISKSTVSRVINNHPNVSKVKREKVLKAIEELSFTPNPTARKMRGNVKNTIGLVIPNVTNPFFSYLVDAVERTASEKNIRLIILQSKEDKQKELDFLNLLKEKQLDGVILSSIENDIETIVSYQQYGSIVFCNEYLNYDKIPTVKIDQSVAAYNGVKHLLDRGYQKIAYCTGGLFAEEGKDKDRNSGFKRALEENGLEINPQWIFVDQHSIKDGIQVLKKISDMKDKPDAIFTGSDEVASGITLAAREMNIKIPEDIAILGFDDQPISEITYPKLSTIQQPIDEMGKLATELMLQLFSEEPMTQVIHELHSKVIVREST